MNSEYERSLGTGLEAEYPVRGSVLLPRWFLWIWVGGA